MKHNRDSFFKFIGSISSGTWNGTTISPTYGGTGLNTYSLGDLLYASAPNTLSKLPMGSSNTALTTSGLTPTWTKIDLQSMISNVLRYSSGGTGLSTYNAGDMIYASASNALSNLPIGASDTALLSNGSIPSYGKVGLTTHVSGVLNVQNGGTGNSSAGPAGSLLGVSDPSTIVPLTAADAGYALISAGSSTLPVYGKITTSHTTGIQANIKYWMFTERKATGVSAGNSIAGVTQRLLNTVFVSDGSEVTLDTVTGIITFTAGTYAIEASCPAYGVGGHQMTLFGVTVGGVYSYGSVEYVSAGNMLSSKCTSKFTLTGTETMRLDHYTSSAVTDGLGKSLGYSYEVYSHIVIVKLA